MSKMSQLMMPAWFESFAVFASEAHSKRRSFDHDG